MTTENFDPISFVIDGMPENLWAITSPEERVRLAELFMKASSPTMRHGASPEELVRATRAWQEDRARIQAMYQTPVTERNVLRDTKRIEERILAQIVAGEVCNPERVIVRLGHERERVRRGHLNETGGKHMSKKGWHSWGTRIDGMNRAKKALANLHFRKPSAWGEATRSEVARNVQSK